MGRGRRQTAAALLVLVLAGRLLWGSGLPGALAARLEPRGETAAAPEETGRPEPEVTPEPEPEETPPPSPVPVPVPEPEAEAMAGETLPRVEDKTPGHPELAALLAEGWGAVLPREGAQILILHSHSTEAYAQTPEDGYAESDPGRTLDRDHSVIRVGDELARLLEEAGFQVVHDREYYDWPRYDGAYARAREAAEAWLEEEPGIRVVIDLHRDALGSAGTAYVTPEGTRSARVMLLLTTGESGLYHPNWRENVKLGLELQRQMEADEPGLSRPLLLSPARYNQQLSPGWLLVEVGADADTLQEALEAARRFGGCLEKVLRRHLTNGGD